MGASEKGGISVGQPKVAKVHMGFLGFTVYIQMKSGLRNQEGENTDSVASSILVSRLEAKKNESPRDVFPTGRLKPTGSASRTQNE